MLYSWCPDVENEKYVFIGKAKNVEDANNVCKQVILPDHKCGQHSCDGPEYCLTWCISTNYVFGSVEYYKEGGREIQRLNHPSNGKNFPNVLMCGVSSIGCAQQPIQWSNGFIPISKFYGIKITTIPEDCMKIWGNIQSVLKDNNIEIKMNVIKPSSKCE